MINDTGTSTRSRFDPVSLDQTDRILLGVCAALWLAALGAGVAAAVALAGLGSRAPGADAHGETPWLLYTVIGVSAVVIVAAVPLLIRARRASLDGESATPAGSSAPSAARIEKPGAAFGDPVQTSNFRGTAGPVIRRQPQPPAGSQIGFPTAAVERILLRGQVVIASAIGGATALIGVATYLIATDHDTAAWVSYGLAALVTVAMPVAPVYFLRQLRAALA